MVNRYRSMLVADLAVGAERHERPSPSLRRLRVTVVIWLLAGLVCCSAHERGVSQLILGVLACALGWGGLNVFRREQAIAKDPAEAVGTILECFRTGRRNQARIKYGFLATDDRVYLGYFHGSASWLKKKGKTLAVVYKLGDPSVSLPLSRFLFYEFGVR